LIQDRARDAAKHPLDQSVATIGPHDQPIGLNRLCLRQQPFAIGQAVFGNGPRCGMYA
jgi:hypothetical protein